MCKHIVLFKNVFSVILTSTIVSSCTKKLDEQLSKIKIINGKEVPENENSQVRKSTVAVKVNSNSESSSCSGVLIAPKVVLTAGHCTQNNDKDKNIKFSNASDYFVYFTTTIDVEQVDANPNINKITASQIIVHPNFQLANLNSNIWKTNDLAIIILSQNHPSTAIPAKFGYNYNISIKKGDNLTLAGYGISKYTETDDTLKLRKIYAYVDTIYMFKEIIQFEIDKKRSVCSGDSGGPAYYTKDSITYLIGISSAGHVEDGACIGGSMYTDLKYYKSWIEENIK